MRHAGAPDVGLDRLPGPSGDRTRERVVPDIDLELDLNLAPEPPAAVAARADAAVQEARHRRALVASLEIGLGGGTSASPQRRPSRPEGSSDGGALPPPEAMGAPGGFVSAASRARGPRLPAMLAATSTGTAAASETATGAATPTATGAGTASTSGSVAGAAVAAKRPLDDALVVPAGAIVRGYVRARALLLAGEIVGNVHCTAGPVVIRAGGRLDGRLVASADVIVCGTVADAGGGAVIATRGKLILAPGSHVEGDVRSGRLDVHDGATLQGVARAFED